MSIVVDVGLGVSDDELSVRNDEDDVAVTMLLRAIHPRTWSV